MRLTTFYILSLSWLGAVAQPVAQHGVLDLRQVNLKTEKVALNGEWHFVKNKLVPPQQITYKPDEFRYFPKIWNENQATGQGYATYAVQVVVNEEPRELALEIPQWYSSYSLWINGQLIARNGEVGTTKAETVPQWKPQTVSFSIPHDTLKIVLQIANFHHFKGGAKDPLYLGSSELLQQQRAMATASNMVEVAVLGVLALAFLLVYLFSGRKKVIMYFALLCLTWAVRGGFSDLYLVVALFPDFDWNTLVRIEYLTLFFTMIWAILFLARIFPKEDNKIVKYALVGSNSLFAGFTLVTQPVVFTQWLPVYLSFCGVLLVYGALIVLRAWVNERIGATFLTVSILLGVMIFSYDVLSYEGFFVHNPIVFSVGYILIFSIMSIVLLLHLNIIKSRPRSSSVLTYEELYKNNDLLAK